MGRADRLMQMVTICQEFGWTYQEYMEQPDYFIALMRGKLVRDNKAQERAAKRMRHGI